MHNRRHILAGAAAFTLGAALPSLAQERDNPMPDALRKALERDPNAPVLGNPDGDVTLTEFFDYNCPFCRKMVPTIQKLIADDPELRVVFREWPVFGEGSEFATRASLASLDQGQYWKFHTALMQIRGKVDEASVMRVVRAVGMDEDKLLKDMHAPRIDKHIDASFALGDHMGLMGTPTFIAGDEAIFGQNSLKKMKALIERAREVLA